VVAVDSEDPFLTRNKEAPIGLASRRDDSDMCVCLNRRKGTE
jgi:hypothetical protein